MSCHAAVITYGSSFGYVATAMTLRPPHYQQHLYQDTVYQVSALPPLRRFHVLDPTAETSDETLPLTLAPNPHLT